MKGLMRRHTPILQSQLQIKVFRGVKAITQGFLVLTVSKQSCDIPARGRAARVRRTGRRPNVINSLLCLIEDFDNYCGTCLLNFNFFLKYSFPRGIGEIHCGRSLVLRHGNMFNNTFPSLLQMWCCCRVCSLLCSLRS
jgi:hypothetical protein